MSVRKESDGRRWVQAEVEVPGTPEEVWEAIATGPGVSSWFVPTERRDDGTIVSDWGSGMTSVARETAWDPPRRFAGEAELGPGGPKMATEWFVEARGGGTCVVRVVHSLFSSADDWDDQLEAIESGWPSYFHNLLLYLKYFRGRPCSVLQHLGFAPDAESETWTRLAGSLGLAGAVVGDHRKAPSGGPRLGGFVESAGDAGHPHGVLMRLDEPGPGIAHLFARAMGGQTVVAIRLYLYGDQAGATVAAEEPRWQAWLNEHCGRPAGPVECS